MELHIVGVDGSDLHAITEGVQGYISPAWSLDGGRIAFASDRNNSADIYVLDFTKHVDDAVENSPAQRLTYGPGRNFSPAWAPSR